jgi:hypothetical protein
MQLLHDTAILPFHCFSRSSVVIRSPAQHMKTEITAVYCCILTITIMIFPPGEYFPLYFYYLHNSAYTVFPFTFIFPRFLIHTISCPNTGFTFLTFAIQKVNRYFYAYWSFSSIMPLVSSTVNFPAFFTSFFVFCTYFLTKVDNFTFCLLHNIPHIS